MAVAFDTVGPSSAGVGSLTATLSWTHTTGAGANAILVFVNNNDGNNHTMTATCNSVSMTSLGLMDETGLTTVTGFNAYSQVFLATGSVTASSGNAIVVTASGVPNYSLNGGSLSFSGYTGNGSIVFAFGTKTAIVASNTSGNLIAGFYSAGNTITQAGAPATGEFLENYEGNSLYQLGNSAGATAPATGSSVTITWTTSATTSVSAGIEMQGATGTNTAAAWAASQDVTAVAGTGTWTNPGNVTGTPDSTWATWVAP